MKNQSLWKQLVVFFLIAVGIATIIKIILGFIFLLLLQK